MIIEGVKKTKSSLFRMKLRKELETNFFWKESSIMAHISYVLITRRKKRDEL